MYILKWSIDAWIYKICISLYTFAADVYSLILDLAAVKVMDDNTVSTYVGNISILVGIFMLFRVAISLLGYLVNPEEIDDKKVGSSSLITGIVMTMAMLLTYSLAFKALRIVQDAILNPGDGNNVLISLFSGSGDKEPGEFVNGINCYYSNGYLTLLDGKHNYDVVVSIMNNSSGGMIYDGLTTYYPGISYDKSSSNVIFYDDYKKVLSKSRITKVSFDSDVSDSSVDDTNTIKQCPQYLVLSKSLFPGEISDTFATNYYSVTLSDKTASGTEPTAGSAIATLDSGKTTQRSYKNDAGRVMAGSILLSFVDCDPAKGTDGEETCANLNAAISRNDFEKTYDYVLDDKSELNDAVSFQSFIALIFGVVLILLLITTTADVAVRAVKLIILEVFAPIPIVLYADPKTRNAFDSWLKTVGVVYADIFVRIAIISISNFIISNVAQTVSGFLKIVLIIGILLFIKEAPQFFCNMLGIKAQGLGNFTLNPMDKLTQVPILGSAISAAGGAATAGIAAAASGEGLGKSLAAAREGASQSWRKNGGMMSTGKEVAPGFVGRTSQAIQQSRKSRVEKNRQTSRDEAMYRIADQVQGTTHSTVGKGNDKGTVVYQAATQPTMRSTVQGIQNTTQSINATTSRIDNTTQGIYATTDSIDRTTYRIDNTTQNINATTGSINRSTRDISNTVHNIDYTTQDISDTTHNIDFTTQNISDTTHNIDFTTQDISDTTHSIDSKIPGPQNPNRIYSNGDDVGE